MVPFVFVGRASELGSMDANRPGSILALRAHFGVVVRWIPRFARHPCGAPPASKSAQPICRKPLRPWPPFFLSDKST